MEERTNLPPSPACPAPANPVPAAVLPWLGLAALLALQYGMFRQYVEREVSWCYPLAADQAGYLGRSYACYEQILNYGPGPGVLFALRQRVPNGLLYEAEAGLLFLVLGPSRLSALTLNFAYFALLQVALAATLRWHTRRWAIAFLGVGVLMTAGTRFYTYGGMADFRLDFAAFCLYGVFVCAVVRSGVFASRRWALAAGAAGALLVLTRHLTAIYLAGAFAGCVGLLCLRLLRRQPGWRPTIIPRVIGVFAAGLIVALFAGPVVLWKWPLIRGYYLTGHFGSAENQVRGQEFGAVDLCGRFFFYAKSLTLDHAGIPFWVLAALIVLVALALALAQLGVRRPREASRQPDAAPSWVILAFAAPCLLVPFAALTLFGSPSPTVGNVMVAPLLWLVLLPVLALRPTGVMVGRAATLLAALAVGVGCSNQARRLSLPLTPRSSRAEFEEVSKLYDRIGAVSRSRGWDTPRVAFATTADSLLPYLITPIVYERQGVLLEPEPLLGGGVCAVSEATALETVRYSDIAVVPLSEKGLDIYPFVSCMREYRPRLLAACRETHIEVGRFRLPAAEVALFVRPSVRVTGADPDGWVPDSGLTLSGDAATLKARPRIELRGPYFAASLPRLPAVRAEVTVPGSGPRLLPARLTVSETEYHLVVELSPDELPDAPEVQIHLDFDTYFVPARRPDLFGDNGDMRRLALRAPAAVTLLPPVDQSERGEQRRGQD